MTLASCILRTAGIFEVARKPGWHFVQAECKESFDSFTACHVTGQAVASMYSPKIILASTKKF